MASKELLLNFILNIDLILHDKQTWFFQEVDTWNYRGELYTHCYTTGYVIEDLLKELKALNKMIMKD